MSLPCYTTVGKSKTSVSISLNGPSFRIVVSLNDTELVYNWASDLKFLSFFLYLPFRTKILKCVIYPIPTPVITSHSLLNSLQRGLHQNHQNPPKSLLSEVPWLPIQTSGHSHASYSARSALELRALTPASRVSLAFPLKYLCLSHPLVRL